AAPCRLPWPANPCRNGGRDSSCGSWPSSRQGFLRPAQLHRFAQLLAAEAPCNTLPGPPYSFLRPPPCRARPWKGKGVHRGPRTTTFRRSVPPVDRLNAEFSLKFPKPLKIVTLPT